MLLFLNDHGVCGSWIWCAQVVLVVNRVRYLHGNRRFDCSLCVESDVPAIDVGPPFPETPYGDHTKNSPSSWPTMGR